MIDKIESLLNFDSSNLDETLRKCGKLYAVVLKKYKNVLLELNKKEIEYSDLYAIRYSYYKCDYDLQLTQSEIKTFLENDIETSKLRLEIKNLKTEAEILEKHLKNIESTRWDIKTLVDFLKIDKII